MYLNVQKLSSCFQSAAKVDNIYVIPHPDHFPFSLTLIGSQSSTHFLCPDEKSQTPLTQPAVVFL
jgi:hypothetical protein